MAKWNIKMWRKRLKSNTQTFLVPCRCSWGMWWCNRQPAAPWPTVDICSRAWQVWGNTHGRQDTWVPGISREHRPQEGGAVMGHCHRQVCIHSRLQHRRISCALLWSKTCCLPVPHAGLRVGKSRRTLLTQRAERESHRCGDKYLLWKCSVVCLWNVLCRRFNVQMQQEMCKQIERAKRSNQTLAS